jgi:tRNA(Ile)-lysidine synthase
MILKKVTDTITEYRLFEPGDRVLVAVSGGADSTALLYLLHSKQAELKISLHVAHLNHLLRKGDAELDQKYVEGMAQKLGLPVTTEAQDVAELAELEGKGIEEAARQARYAFFDDLAHRVGANKIAVGHTADDNVETFLMRLLRGSGLKGLCGIPTRRGNIVRPLIKVWRREIEDYVGALKLVPRRDHTNYESKYLRNSVRLKLIPQLKIYNLNIKEIILQTILLLTEDHQYLENTTDQVLEAVMDERSGDRIVIDIEKIRRYDLPIQGHVIRRAIERIKGNLTELTFQHIRDILGKLASTERWQLHLPGGIVVLGEREELSVCREKPKLPAALPFARQLAVPGETEIPEIGKKIRVSFTENIDKGADPAVAFIDYDSLAKEVLVRNRLPGDRFSPLGLKGTKKLQDFFIDEKVPAGERDSVPIVESGGKILWVAGFRIDEAAKVAGAGARILKMELL